jgi:hypothetical protein
VKPAPYRYRSRSRTVHIAPQAPVKYMDQARPFYDDNYYTLEEARKNSDTRTKPLPLANGNGRYIYILYPLHPNRHLPVLVSVGEWPPQPDISIEVK